LGGETILNICNKEAHVRPGGEGPVNMYINILDVSRRLKKDLCYLATPKSRH